MAADIIFNAKTQRIGVCNACESLVIHRDIIDHALPAIKLRLDEKNVEMRGDARAMQACDGLVPATEEDFLYRVFGLYYQRKDGEERGRGH